MSKQSVKERLEALKERVEKAALRAGRKPDEIAILLATKNVSAEKIYEAYEAGHRDFGENRVQEMLKKREELDIRFGVSDIRWHMIGVLQTNKVKKIVPFIYMVQSVDREKLVDEIEKRAKSVGRKVPVLIEVNSSGEPTKHGVSPSEVLGLAEYILERPHLELVGIMTIGPLTDNPSLIREAFRKTRRVFEALRDALKGDADIRILSMGMSGDFEIAIEEGSTMIRVGTAVFGPRRASP